MVSRRNFMKAVGADAGAACLETCIGPAIDFSDPEPTDLEKLVSKALKNISDKKYAAAESDLEKQYKWHKDDIGYCAVLGIAQASNKQYSKADKTFCSLIDAFENKPETIITIRDRIRPLFETEAYPTLHRQLRTSAAFMSNLYVVDGFLSLAEYKFDNAIEAFAQIIPKYPEKISLYKTLMDRLAAHFHNSRNTVARDGYQKMSQFFQMHLPTPLR